MIKDYKELKMRKNLDLRFEEYKQDWKHKEQIVQGDFIPSVELYESEIDLLLRMCDHANTLNRFQPENQKEIESLKKLLTKKKEAFEFAAAQEQKQVESRYTMLETEKQLDTILFVLSESRKEIMPFGKNKGQISLGI